MELDLIIMTLYGGCYGLYLLKLSYDLGNEFHHWRFGVITTMAIIPIILIYQYYPKDYYLSIIIMGLIIGPTSFSMDYHDFKKWYHHRHKLKNK